MRETKFHTHVNLQEQLYILIFAFFRYKKNSNINSSLLPEFNVLFNFMNTVSVTSVIAGCLNFATFRRIYQLSLWYIFPAFCWRGINMYCLSVDQPPYKRQLERLCFSVWYLYYLSLHIVHQQYRSVADASRPISVPRSFFLDLSNGVF
jgi:hypothetical protein